MSLTELIVSKVPNHYAAWTYRKQFISQQTIDHNFLEREKSLCLGWINQDPKSFQSWDHLKFIYDLIGFSDYMAWRLFMESILLLDCRNYHCWVFRTWFVKRFSVFEDELIWANEELVKDLKNNSLWAYRHFISVQMKLDETSYEGGKNGDNHPMAWYHEFDGGRAFYTGLGHTLASYDNPKFRQHLLGGIAWCLKR